MAKDEKPKSVPQKPTTNVPKPASGSTINLGQQRGETKGNVPRMENKPKPPASDK